MAETEKKTGNEPVSGTDPGGTHPAPGKVKGDKKKIEPHVESGDRNALPQPGEGPER